MRIPGSCVRAANEAEQAYQLLERGVAAARDLDARQLEEVVDAVQQKRPKVEELVRQCRQRSAQGDVEVTPMPTS